MYSGIVSITSDAGKSPTNLKRISPRITPKNCLNKDMRASKSFAVPETRLRDVISSNAVVMANPGIKTILTHMMRDETLAMIFLM